METIEATRGTRGAVRRSAGVTSAWMLLFGLIGRSVGAQEAGLVEVPFTVTTVSGASVYIDVGSARGLLEGDPVRLEPIGGEFLEGVLRNVSRTSSRVVLAVGTAVVPGTTGVVLVPSERFESAPSEPDVVVASPAGEGSRPPLPTEWEEPPTAWEGDLPLLAHALGSRGSRRPRDWTGSLFFDTGLTLDDGRSYLSGATGMDLRVGNPFGQGGLLQGDLEFFTRSAKLDEGFDVTERELLIQRLYYTNGGSREEPHQYTVGRFLPTVMPEFGLLDGGEYIHRLGPGQWIGTSAGYLTGHRDDLQPGEDAQVSGFWRFEGEADGRLSGRTGFQKTYHQGDADRDLFVGSLRYRPAGRLSFDSSLWIDYYSSDDDLKSSSFEVTRFSASGIYGGAGHGLVARLSSQRYPQLLSDTYAGIPDDQVSDERVDQLSLNGWLDAGDELRINASTQAWQDRDASGSGWELGLTLRDKLFADGSVGASVYAHTLEVGEDLGLRLSASKRLGLSRYRAYYDLRRYDFETESGENDGSIQHQLRLSYDRELAGGWSISSYAAGLQRDGDASISLGLTLRWDF